MDMPGYEEYLERIDKVIVKENFNVGLGFKDGYIFFRVANRELFPLLYDPFAEITNFAGAGNVALPTLTYLTAQEFKSDTLASTNIFRIDKTDHMYQLFYGFSPGLCKVFPAYPRETEINQMDEGLHTQAYTIFGFIDGFESPINKPSPRSQLFVPYGPLIGFGFYNPAPYSIKPMFRFIVNRLRVETITDVELIMKILQHKEECTLATVGGIDNPWGTGTQNYVKWYGVSPISLLANRAEVVSAVSPPAKPGGQQA
jgi:hypothetical protein